MFYQCLFIIFKSNFLFIIFKSNFSFKWQNAQHPVIKKILVKSSLNPRHTTKVSQYLLQITTT